MHFQLDDRTTNKKIRGDSFEWHLCSPWLIALQTHVRRQPTDGLWRTIKMQMSHKHPSERWKCQYMSSMNFNRFFMDSLAAFYDVAQDFVRFVGMLMTMTRVGDNETFCCIIRADKISDTQAFVDLIEYPCASHGMALMELFRMLYALASHFFLGRKRWHDRRMWMQRETTQQANDDRSACHSQRCLLCNIVLTHIHFRRFFFSFSPPLIVIDWPFPTEHSGACSCTSDIKHPNPTSINTYELLPFLAFCCVAMHFFVRFSLFSSSLRCALSFAFVVCV